MLGLTSLRAALAAAIEPAMGIRAMSTTHLGNLAPAKGSTKVVSTIHPYRQNTFDSNDAALELVGAAKLGREVLGRASRAGSRCSEDVESRWRRRRW
jgi:hypothetical protein